MSDADILSQVHTLVAREHELRSRRESGDIDPADERAQLQEIEEQLDQCWDLLRQREARQRAGGNPDDATARPTREVEGYLQ